MSPKRCTDNVLARFSKVTFTLHSCTHFNNMRGLHSAGQVFTTKTGEVHADRYRHGHFFITIAEPFEPCFNCRTGDLQKTLTPTHLLAYAKDPKVNTDKLPENTRVDLKADVLYLQAIFAGYKLQRKDGRNECIYKNHFGNAASAHAITIEKLYKQRKGHMTKDEITADLKLAAREGEFVGRSWYKANADLPLTPAPTPVRAPTPARTPALKQVLTRSASVKIPRQREEVVQGSFSLNLPRTGSLRDMTPSIYNPNPWSSKRLRKVTTASAEVLGRAEED